MEFAVLAEPFAAALAAANRIAGKTTLPVTACVLLRSEGDRLTLTATNFELTLQTEVTVKGKSDGLALVNASTLHAWVSAQPNDRIDLATTDSTISLACGRSKARFPLADANDFPPMPVMTDAQTLTMSAPELRRAIRLTIIAVAGPKEPRAVLTGINITCEGNSAKFIAGDSHRLAVCRAPMMTDATGALTLLIPATSLREVDRLLGKEEGPVTILADRERVRFTVGRTELTCQQIAGTFPNVTKALPQPGASRATLAVEDFAAAVRRCATVGTSGGALALTMQHDGEVGALHLAARSPDLGDNEAAIDAVLEGDPVPTIRFPAGQLADLLGVLEGKVTMALTGPHAMAVFWGDSGAESYQHIIVPWVSGAA